jgi:predicted amidohydrolase YtcJ
MVVPRLFCYNRRAMKNAALREESWMRGIPRSVFAVSAVAVLFGWGSVGCGKKPDPGTLVLLNGEIHTGQAGFSDARAMVITGNTITAVCKTDDWAKRYIGEETRVIDLQGQFVLPGLIDSHVDFAAAGGLINDADLLSVSDEAGLRREIGRVAALLPAGEWITEGRWGANEEAAGGDAGSAPKTKTIPWRPNRSMIDDLTPQHPCFLCRFDETIWLANGAALKAAGLEGKRLPGMEIGPDGRTTGIIVRPSPAFESLAKARRPKSSGRLLDENRAALKVLRESGITEIHDISTPEQTERFVELEAGGELTCRIWLRPDLSRGAELKAAGLTMGLHPKTKQKSYRLRYGALWGAVDGALVAGDAFLFEPYSDQPGNTGRGRPASAGDPEPKSGAMDKMYELIRTGSEAGFVPNIRASGDRAVAEILDLFERIEKERQQPLKGFRIGQAQVVRPQDFKRFRGLGLIAEINPSLLEEDMRWLEERLGPERAKGALAFKSLLDSGAMLVFGSNWPGTGSERYRVHPKYLIHAAVTRGPGSAWLPEERISVKDAIKAYTINAAVAAFEDDVRGTLEPGKLADVTVFDRNLLKIKPADILKAEVMYTIVDGRIVFERK